VGWIDSDLYKRKGFEPLEALKTPAMSNLIKNVKVKTIKNRNIIK